MKLRGGVEPMRGVLVLFFSLVWVASSLAYRPYTYSPPRRPGGLHLQSWFKRDLRPYDQRYQVISILRKMRALIARSESLGLTSAQKSSLIGLKNALEKDMVKTLKEIKSLSRTLEDELSKKDFNKDYCLKLQKEINQLWAQISDEALRTLLKAYQLVSPKSQN